MSPTKTQENIKKFEVQNKLINEYIEHEQSKMKFKKINEEIRKIESTGGLNSTAFWEFKKQMDSGKQKEVMNAIRNEDGELQTNKEEIKKVFKQFYTNLFTVNNDQKSITDKIEETIFESIKLMSEKMGKDDNNYKNENEIKVQEIEDNIKTLKNKHTSDCQGWSNNILKNSGSDVIQSLNIMLNEIDKQKIIPNEWIELIIKSIYKNKGKRCDMENRRGLFITSIISKLYEKIKLNKNEDKLNKSISKYQCGGTKGKSTVDHIMTLNAIIDYHIYINSETYVLFADEYKCFDRLNLKNCIIDLYKAVGAKEAMEIYRLNKKGNATISTPMGNIGPIDANEIVRQGTIMGPKLCCMNTDKINNIGRICITNIGQKVKTGILTYVDDINYATSNLGQIKKAVANLRCMERTKGYTFNTEVSKTSILIINKKKKKNYNDITLNVKKGKIEMSNEYKYLGEWYNEKGDHSTSIEKKKQKIPLYIKQIKFYGNEYILGKYTLLTRIKIYKTIVIPTIYYNIETWSKISKKELNQLETIQGTILRAICEQRKTTPYIGLLAELGIWTIEKLIEYKKIMLLHNIMTSNKDRLIKEIIMDQIDNTWPGCWAEQVKEIYKKYNININEINSYTKYKLKEIAKKQINKAINEELINQKTQKTKLIAICIVTIHG